MLCQQVSKKPVGEQIQDIRDLLAAKQREVAELRLKIQRADFALSVSVDQQRRYDDILLTCSMNLELNEIFLRGLNRYVESLGKI